MFLPSKLKGFTLLEVLIAMAIIGIVFVSVFRMHAGNIRLVQREKFDSIAPLLAAKQLALIETDIMKYDNMSDEFDKEYKGYKWRCEISDMSLSDFDDSDSALDKNSIEDFKKITLTISGFDKEHIYKIITWRYVESQ
ncbi:MAG: prepilin-type N-terminal cleavage/methylation domain-containing protein [Desulfobacteraceae bacterium]|nr:prepilin-type N-terminal cleavage/methylation domain-containing protein [Desulfobacteraceae bacterium]